MSAATAHWIQRVQERVENPPDPVVLARGIIWAIQAERHDLVEFVARTNRNGQRLFRFRVPSSGKMYYALVDTEKMVCVTVLKPGMAAGRIGKGPLKLTGDDL